MLKLGDNVSGRYGGDAFQSLGSGGVKQQLVTAGIITANVKVSSAGMEHRANYANKENYIIGSSVNAAALGSGADPRGNVNIRPFDLLLTYKEVPKSELSKYSYGQALAQFRPPTFSSFTGMDTGIKTEEYRRTGDDKTDYNSQELLRLRLQNKFVKIGFSADWYTFNEATQKDSGVAAIVAGSFTTTHTGTDVIMPGQLVQWCAPPVVPEFIDKYVRARRTSPGYASQMQDGRFPALLEPFSAKNSAHTLVRQAALLVQKATQPAALLTLFGDKDGRDPLKASSALDAQSNAVTDFALAMAKMVGGGAADAQIMLDLLASAPAAGESPQDQTRRNAMFTVVEAMAELFHITSEKIVGRSLGLAFPGQGLKMSV